MGRHRPAAFPLVKRMEGVKLKNLHFWLCLLVSPAALFWLCLFYFHSVVLGGGGVGAITYPQLDSVSSNAELRASQAIEPSPSSIGLSNTVSHSEVVVGREGERLVVNSSKDEILDQLNPKNVKCPYVRMENKDRPNQGMGAYGTVENKSDSCAGKFIYVHDLPPRFNEDMLKECETLNPWTNMCKFIKNAGLGAPLENVEGVFSNTGWYATHQFALDVIFSNRMKQYECLTNDSSLAAAIFVPFYVGLDIGRYLWGHNISTRDTASRALVDLLIKRPEWSIMGGKDHFLVGGRITWDFRRLTDKESDWGNNLLLSLAVKNMTMLLVESSPWNANDYAIPYPTYFHPARDVDVFNWQDRMRKLERKYLFCFAGAPRPGKLKSIRGLIIHQCKNSRVCELLECGFGESKCHSPNRVMQMFQSSVFCLQPQGDSYTRRSAFDSMLAGCIPVFFHPDSAYTQYNWHLPENYSLYSVLIPENDIRKNMSIEQRLGQISTQKVKEIREAVINLIPQIIYADPRSKLETLKDAFDGAVQVVIDKVTKLRKGIIEGHKDDNFRGA